MGDTQKERILVIEDEEHIAEALKLNLTIQGYNVKISPDGITGLNKWRAWLPDLIVLDIMLPMIDGFSVLRTIRKEDKKIPVLILSAKASIKDKIKGFHCGVDDYLAKPFNLDEFLLRVQRLLAKKAWYIKKNNKILFNGDSYTFGINHINFITCNAQCTKGKITLTKQEIKLLKIFIANKGKTVSREKLLETGWGYSSDITTRTLDNFIVRFRKYFEKNPKKPCYFKSRRAVGYIFDH
ncbi:MAG: DNA-binding response regulator [Desulfobacteraceae bacterium 4572_130]|nr:MAG: DNA-binding response regulator [Desulfobacteraceae bacterium 4572_130]